MFNDKNVNLQLISMAMDVASSITESCFQKVREQMQHRLLADLLNFPMPHLHNVIDGLDLGDNFRQPKLSLTPILLLTGTLDGRTYIEGQKQAIAHFNMVT